MDYWIALVGLVWFKFENFVWSSSRFQDPFSFPASISVCRVSVRLQVRFNFCWNWSEFSIYSSAYKPEQSPPIILDFLLYFQSFQPLVPTPIWVAVGESPICLRPPNKYHRDHLAAGYQSKLSDSIGLTVIAVDSHFLSSFSAAVANQATFLLQWATYGKADYPDWLLPAPSPHWDHSFQMAFLSLFVCFAASRRPDIVDYHSIHAPLAKTNILKPTLTTVLAAIASGVATLAVISPLSDHFLTSRRPDFIDCHHQRVPHRLGRQSQLAATPSSSPFGIFGDEHCWHVWCLFACLRSPSMRLRPTSPCTHYHV